MADTGSTASALPFFGHGAANVGNPFRALSDAEATTIVEAARPPGCAPHPRRIAGRSLAFDVHEASPRHLAQASRLAADLPGLRIVIDHLGKPPQGCADLAERRAATYRRPSNDREGKRECSRESIRCSRECC